MSTAISDTDTMWERLMKHGNMASIARAVGVSPQSIKDWREGKTCPGMKSIDKIQAAFPDISVEQIRQYHRRMNR